MVTKSSLWSIKTDNIFNEKNSELIDLEPLEIDIKIPKKFSKSQIKKID